VTWGLKKMGTGRSHFDDADITNASQAFRSAKKEHSVISSA
jgi:hypothetical protein